MHKYELSFKITDDDGETVFSTSSKADYHEKLMGSLAWDIKRMLSLMDEPPSTAEVVRALEINKSRTILGTIAEIEAGWDGRTAFENGFSVEVDLEKLMTDSTDDERRYARKAIQAMGWRIKGDPQPDTQTGAK